MYRLTKARSVPATLKMKPLSPVLSKFSFLLSSSAHSGLYGYFLFAMAHAAICAILGSPYPVPTHP